ncbi:hypothetical protein WN55_10893 [Dufourea novaeangliae]|uniref:Uncharacterized protein n=1 Tax=Dufourea novaeangliae TaxID=178035 RepID=A0A154P9P3_DUFNO|nr:hypothetical protein WN55_10893 [Dufourea novaeangliae]
MYSKPRVFPRANANLTRLLGQMVIPTFYQRTREPVSVLKKQPGLSAKFRTVTRKIDCRRLKSQHSIKNRSKEIAAKCKSRDEQEEKKTGGKQKRARRKLINAGRFPEYQGPLISEAKAKPTRTSWNGSRANSLLAYPSFENLGTVSCDPTGNKSGYVLQQQREPRLAARAKDKDIGWTNIERFFLSKSRRINRSAKRRGQTETVEVFIVRCTDSIDKI